MKMARLAVTALAGLAVLGPLFAQEKPAPDAKNSFSVLKIQVTITEHEGDKKVANLPYTFFVRAGEAGGPSSPWTKLRMGSRIPVVTASLHDDSGRATGSAVNLQYQYLDVGSQIDARAIDVGEGRFDLTLNLERSWVAAYVPLQNEGQPAPMAEPNGLWSRQPNIRQFKTELSLTMRDGQTVQSAQATDPVSGRVLTITVTMNVVK